MPSLNEQQRQQLIQMCNNAPINFLIEHIFAGNISIEELTNLNDARKNIILEKLVEKEWNHIAGSISDINSQNYETLCKWQKSLTDYINKYESTQFQANIQDARSLLSQVEAALIPIIRQKEQKEWDEINSFDRQTILDFYHKYPITTHFSEIDDYFWNTLNLKDSNDLNLYVAEFSPRGKHLSDVENIKRQYDVWNQINLQDIFLLKDFIDSHPYSPFMNEAKQQYTALKDSEFNAMKKSPSSYEIERLKRLVDSNIVSVEELVMHDIFKSHDAFYKHFERLENTFSMLPDINATIANSSPTPLIGNNHTDIFLFGIPSTGKTCVLMGLSSTEDLQVSLVGGGGEYAAALQLYTECGKTIGRTPGNFVTTINAKINDKKDVHNINIVEMSGEEFAYDIVHNPNRKFTFEDMATGTTEILKNGNKKVFFIIIDPTADAVKVERDIMGLNQYGEEVVVDTHQLLVNQRITINKLINIFDDMSNADIMKKVDAIHFIMTKADMLDGLNGKSRNENAMDIFEEKYKNFVLQPLVDICNRYNINYSTHHQPKLYTFSLGDFYIGGLYDYNPTDSNRLVTAIKNVTKKQHKQNFIDKLRKIFN